MQLSEIENKLKAKRKAFEKESVVLEKSKNKISVIKNDITELEKQIVNKKNEELLSLIKSKSITVDEVIKLVSTYSNTLNPSDLIKEESDNKINNNTGVKEDE